MKMKNKALFLMLCAVLLVTASVLGTMAYLTDRDEVTNTFTVGKITLGDGDLEEGLDEADVNEKGQLLDKDGNLYESDDQTIADRVKENEYKLLPGHTYIKDPTVHVKNDSEDSYIFVTVQNGIEDIEAASVTGGYQRVAAQILANGWTATQLTDDDGNIVYYKTWTEALNEAGQPDVDDNGKPVTTGTTDLLVFAQFQIDGEKVVNVPEGEEVPEGMLDVADYASETILIKAYAVQMDGFASAEAAWSATFGA